MQNTTLVIMLSCSVREWITKSVGRQDPTKITEHASDIWYMLHVHVWSQSTAPQPVVISLELILMREEIRSSSRRLWFQLRLAETHRSAKHRCRRPQQLKFTILLFIYWPLIRMVTDRGFLSSSINVNLLSPWNTKKKIKKRSQLLYM